MSSLLFSFTATPHEARRLNRELNKAAHGGDCNPLNNYFGKLCKRYGHADPESCQITIVTQEVFVSDYPSFEEILAGADSQKGAPDA